MSKGKAVAKKEAKKPVAAKKAGEGKGFASESKSAKSSRTEASRAVPRGAGSMRVNV